MIKKFSSPKIKIWFPARNAKHSFSRWGADVFLQVLLRP